MRALKIGMVMAALGTAGTPLLTGCSQGDGRGEQEQAGTLALSLTGTSSLGARYRLHNGSFTVTGPKAVTLSTETDPESPFIRPGAAGRELRDQAQERLESRERDRRRLYAGARRAVLVQSGGLPDLQPGHYVGGVPVSGR